MNKLGKIACGVAFGAMTTGTAIGITMAYVNGDPEYITYGASSGSFVGLISATIGSIIYIENTK